MRTIVSDSVITRIREMRAISSNHPLAVVSSGALFAAMAIAIKLAPLIMRSTETKRPGAQRLDHGHWSTIRTPRKMLSTPESTISTHWLTSLFWRATPILMPPMSISENPRTRVSTVVAKTGFLSGYTADDVD